MSFKLCAYTTFTAFSLISTLSLGHGHGTLTAAALASGRRGPAQSDPAGVTVTAADRRRDGERLSVQYGYETGPIFLR